MVLTQKNQEVLDYVKENGGRVSIQELADGLGRTPRSVSANVTSLAKEDKGFVVREKVAVEGEDKPVTFVVLTEAGANFVPSEDEE